MSIQPSAKSSRSTGLPRIIITKMYKQTSPTAVNKTIPGTRKSLNGEPESITVFQPINFPDGSSIIIKPLASAEIPVKISRMRIIYFNLFYVIPFTQQIIICIRHMVNKHTRNAAR